MASAAEQLAANFNFSNFGKAKELRDRILFTLAILLVARLGTYIPMPGIDPISSDPNSVKFCHRIGLNYVSCSPYRVPIARLAAAQAAIRFPRKAAKRSKSSAKKAGHAKSTARSKKNTKSRK